MIAAESSKAERFGVYPGVLQDIASRATSVFLFIHTAWCSRGIKALRSNIASFGYDVFPHPNVVAEGSGHACLRGASSHRGAEAWVERCQHMRDGVA